MPGFIARNWRLKLLALVLAIVAWAGVVYATNPPGTRSVSVPVPQGSPGVSLPAGYLLTARIPNLTIYITGTQNSLSTFNLNSLQVSVEWDAIKAIGNRVPATVRLPARVTNSDPNIDLDNPPTSVEAQVDLAGSATEAVTVAVSHAPPPGYEVEAGGVTATPSTVTATGPEHELIGIQVKTEPIDLSNQRANYTASDVLLFPYDKTGQPLSGVNLEPPFANVQIQVNGLSTTRTSGVVIGPVIDVPSGVAVSAISYTPMTVTLTGSQDLLNDATLATVTTGPVDIAGQSGTVTYHLSISVPTGITASPSSVAVTITVTPIPTPTPVPTPPPSPSATATT